MVVICHRFNCCRRKLAANPTGANSPARGSCAPFYLWRCNVKKVFSRPDAVVFWGTVAMTAILWVLA